LPPASREELALQVDQVPMELEIASNVI